MVVSEFGRMAFGIRLWAKCSVTCAGAVGVGSRIRNALPSINFPFFEVESCWVLGCMRIFGVTVLVGVRVSGLVVQLIVSFGEGWGFRLLANRIVAS